MGQTTVTHACAGHHEVARVAAGHQEVTRAPREFRTSFEFFWCFLTFPDLYFLPICIFGYLVDLYASLVDEHELSDEHVLSLGAD